MSIMSTFLASPVIAVLVGSSEGNGDRHKLYIHKDKIAWRSRFFSSTLSNRWQNAESNIIDMHKFDPNIQPEDMARYLEVVYNNFVSTQNYENLFRVYAIAEAMLDRVTRNICVKVMYCDLEEHNTRLASPDEYPGMACVKHIFSATATSKNPMRRFLVDFRYDNAAPEWYRG